MNNSEKAAKEVQIFEWLKKQGYDRRASKDIAPIIVKYLDKQVIKVPALIDKNAETTLLKKFWEYFDKESVAVNCNDTERNEVIIDFFKSSCYVSN